MKTRRFSWMSMIAFVTLAGTLAFSPGCRKGDGPQVGVDLPLQRVVLYRNGVGYFERAGKVEGDKIRFRVRESQVGDFLASLTVVTRDGKPVEFVSFPLPEEEEEEETPPCVGMPMPYPVGYCPGNVPPPPDDGEEEEEEDTVEVAVRLQEGAETHDVIIAYVVESPIWRPTWRS